MQTAVRKLFDQGHFSICELDKIIDIVGARQGGEAYKLLRALHCVDYAKMQPELRAKVPELVNECLRQQASVIEAAEVALQGVAI